MTHLNYYKHLLCHWLDKEGAEWCEGSALESSKLHFKKILEIYILVA